jgi:uncharacterized surface protein with fasciclin (FAS1) repeats
MRNGFDGREIIAMMRAMLVAAACLAATACGQDDTGNNVAGPAPASASGGEAAAGGDRAADASLLAALSKTGDLKVLTNAVNAAGLTATLSGAQPYTLFAPTDAAFDKLPAGTVNDLLAPDSKGQLTALLTGLIVPGTVTAEDLGRAIERGKGKAQLATVGGSTLTFTRSGDAIVVAGPKGQAKLAGAGPAANGVLHKLDTVLTP